LRLFCNRWWTRRINHLAYFLAYCKAIAAQCTCFVFAQLYHIAIFMAILSYQLVLRGMREDFDLLGCIT
jgi:hypothetical protein